jgi:hypothetical protein
MYMKITGDGATHGAGITTGVTDHGELTGVGILTGAIHFGADMRITDRHTTGMAGIIHIMEDTMATDTTEEIMHIVAAEEM